MTEIDYFRYFTAHPSLRQHRPAIGLQKWPEPIGLYTHRVENYEEQYVHTDLTGVDPESETALMSAPYFSNTKTTLIIIIRLLENSLH